MKKDPQVEQILSRYNIRREKKADTAIREKCEERLGVTNHRKMNYPMYNLKLKRDQYDKLFKGKPMRTFLGKHKSRKGGSSKSIIRLGFSSSSAMRTVKKRDNSDTKKATLAELKEDDED